LDGVGGEDVPQVPGDGAHEGGGNEGTQGGVSQVEIPEMKSFFSENKQQDYGVYQDADSIGQGESGVPEVGAEAGDGDEGEVECDVDDHGAGGGDDGGADILLGVVDGSDDAEETP